MGISDAPEPRPKKWLTWRRCVVIVGALLLAMLLRPWAGSLIDLGDPECEFDTVTAVDFRQLLAEARRLPWRLETGDISPRQEFWDYPIEGKLLNRIHQLVPSQSRSVSEELAATHAVMRSIGAEISRIDGEFKFGLHLYYLLPAWRLRRGGVLNCLDCFVLPYQGLRIVFRSTRTNAAVVLDEIRYDNAVSFDLSTGRIQYPGYVGSNVRGRCLDFSDLAGGQQTK